MILIMYAVLEIIAFVSLLSSVFIRERVSKLLMLLPAFVLFPTLASTGLKIETINCISTSCTLTSYIFEDLAYINNYMTWGTGILALLYVIILVFTIFNIKKSNQEEMYF